MRISVVAGSGEGVNAIGQASRCLVGALQQRGHDASFVVWTPGEIRAAAAQCDALVLQYNPFLYGRRGFAPALLRDVSSVRAGRKRPRIVLVVHEPYVPIDDWRSFLMGTWQRVQLDLLLAAADRSFASIEMWAARLGRFRQVIHLPSGSNLPDARSDREAVRTELGVQDDLVVATLSTGHPSHLSDYVSFALERLARDGLALTYLQLGAGSAPIAASSALRLVRPGELPSDRLAALVAASDLLLTPFVDGVSTRRSSFMAGLQQGVAVVGTTGELTDPSLLPCGLELVPVGDPSLFAMTVAEIAFDGNRRDRAASRGRELFEERFTWDVIADTLLAQLVAA